MKERTYPEGISDMAASAQSQANELLKCGQAIEGSNMAAAGYDPRPYAYRALDEAMQSVGMATTASGHDGAAMSLMRAAEALESRASDAQRLGWDAEAKDCATKAAAARKKSLEHAAKARELAPKSGGGMLVKALHGLRDLLAKAQVKGYTKGDGTVVQAYNSKVTAKPHPGKGFAPGAQVYHPHPAPGKAGKQGLGTYKGTTEDGSQSVVEHGGAQYAVPHEAVKGASGVPGGSKKVAPIKSHPNFEADDYQALKDKGYDDDEIRGIWDRDTARNGGNPTGGQARDDLKLPTQEHPDGQPGPAAKASQKALLMKKPKAQPSADGAATGATPKQLDLMESSLANDEEASDEELVAHFVEQGVPEAVAKQAVTHRDAFTSTAIPENGLLAKLMKKDAAGKGGSADAGDVSRETGDVSGEGGPAGGPVQDADGAAGAPPHGDANEAGWGNLPDEENPEHAMSGFSSKHLGALSTMKPEHAKAHAHAELQNRGLDSQGEWAGFDKAKAHHGPSIPDGFKPVHGDDPDANGFQQVHRKVLSAAAQGHLDLQKRAKSELAARGHDHNGNWVGFEKAKAMHLGGKAGDLTKSILFVMPGPIPSGVPRGGSVVQK